jgi:predicted O-methyltransferase YrrM
MGAKDLLFKTFRTIDRAGMHALPKHYYSPVPDCSWLEDNRPLWIGRSSLTGIAWDLPAQMAWLKDVCESYYSEVAGLESYRALARNGSGPGFSEIEAQVLHCFIRRFAPERVIEIGSGVSTLCMLEAARLNHREGKASSQITCVEPYPSDRLKNSKEIELIPEFCQKVPLDLFDQLSSGDLLFIDCSHAVKIGSDVLRIYLEIIPRLAPGIYIHIHDIYLPYAYPRTVFTRPWWWQETAMLMALLINNPKLPVMSCMSALHYDYPKQLQELLTDYFPAPNDEGLSVSPPAEGHYPSSIWLRTA